MLGGGPSPHTNLPASRPPTPCLLACSRLLQVNMRGRRRDRRREDEESPKTSSTSSTTYTASEIAKKGPSGEYFIDRNPDLFAIILEYYRNKAIIVPKATSIAALYKELDYFGTRRRVSIQTLCSFFLSFYFFFSF